MDSTIGGAAGEEAAGFGHAGAGQGQAPRPPARLDADLLAADVSAPLDNGSRASDASRHDSPVLTEEDPATAEAARRLSSGRLGYRFVKRLFDIVFSALVLVVLCWLYAIVAAAVKLDSPGPAIFKQERVGLNGRTFTMYKFRSMTADAEERLAEIADLNEKDGPVFKVAHDPRVTRVGRFIRKTSLDEMPQFMNVLKGDMSVVGPRPALPREVSAYTPRQRQRLLVKPGLTCFWQVQRHRDQLPFGEWVELDLKYVRECSARRDLGLIVRTVGAVLTGQGE